MNKERLHKIVSRNTGISLRNCEKMILKGLIKVNNNIVNKLGYLIDVKSDVIFLNNKIINISYEKRKHCYYIFNKPRGVICSKFDNFNRKTIYNFLNSIDTKIKERLFIVGRLDYLSEGIILLTTNRKFINYALNPINEIKKIYKVKIKGKISYINYTKIKEKKHFFYIGDIKFNKNNTWLKIVLLSGENNYIKKMFWEYKYLILRIIRISFANISLEGIKPGFYKKIEKNIIFFDIY